MQTVAPFGTASGNSKQDWRNSDAYRQWRPTGMGFQKITQSSDGQTFGDTGEARAYDAWRAGQAQPRPTQATGTPYGGDMKWLGTTGQRNFYNWDDRDYQGAPPPAAGPAEGQPFPRVKLRDPREEMTRLQQRQTQGGGSAWDHPSNHAVRERVNAAIAEYDRLKASGNDFTTLGHWTVSPPASQRPATPSNQDFTRGWNEAMAPYANIPGVRITPAVSYGGEGLGNLAYAQSRPEAFQQSMRGFGSQMAPNDFVAQRDAFIQRLNEERGKLSAQAGVYGNNDKPNFYRPSRDFGALWKQAGDMVKDGWKNPLAGLFG